ncbi:M23 family metallopeptidase [Planococcus sp. A6]|uniref:M23 family metallopeptidase n=1 Tax=Planococcus sp. A6 TaxID=2992760 RepID=UPI00237B1BAD|nr:M23 family metallopeptidase [Planococcus sp. A6]MDE0584397.1 M23 family metallopeptidase [Planococcus sp. A6]
MNAKHQNEEKLKLRKWKIGTALVLAASAFGANTIFAEPNEPQNLEPVYHIYHNTSYLGAVSDDAPIDELIDEKLKTASSDYDNLRLAPSEELNIVTEQAVASSSKDDDTVISQLDEQLKVKAEAFALQVDGERVGRSETREKILKEPVDKIVLEGDKKLPGIGTGEFMWPADGGYVSSKKGQRWGRAHKGIDIARPDTLDIVSADHGTVTKAGKAGTFGNRVVVDHKNGYETIYAHLSSIDVKVGDKVSPHTKLGDMGTTGRSTGIHLHFELSYEGQDRDPLDYVKE